MAHDGETAIGRVLLAAVAVAFSARGGRVQPHAVADLRQLAEALPPDHPLRFEAIAFAAAFDTHRRDPQALASLGEALDRGITRILRRDPADLERKDIHG